MSLVAIILIIVLLGGIGWGYPWGGASVGPGPTRPAYWGGGPQLGGILGLVLVIVLILALLHHI